MAKKQSKSVGSKVLKFAMIIPAALSLMGNFFSLVQTEMMTMRKQLLCFIMLSLFSLMLMLSSWIFLNALILTYLMHVPFTLLSSLSLILAGNLFLLILTCVAILYLQIDPTFPETRKTIREIVTRK
jgi:hypothetical protein